MEEDKDVSDEDEDLIEGDLPASVNQTTAAQQLRSLNSELGISLQVRLTNVSALDFFVDYLRYICIAQMPLAHVAFRGDPSPEVILRDLDPQSMILCGLSGSKNSPNDSGHQNNSSSNTVAPAGRNGNAAPSASRSGTSLTRGGRIGLMMKAGLTAAASSVRGTRTELVKVKVEAGHEKDEEQGGRKKAENGNLSR